MLQLTAYDRAQTAHWATEDEIAKLQAEPGAPHVWFACRCGHSHVWHAKNLTLSADGSYNNSRNIFYTGHDADGVPECSCPGSNLRCIVFDTEESDE